MELALSPNYSPQLLIFYFIAFLVSYILLVRKSGYVLISLLTSLLLVFVASEYYEIPIFIRYGTTEWLHSINIVWMFILLVWFAEIQFSPKNIALLCLGPVLTGLILFSIPQLIYLARIIGLSILMIVTINSPGVGGKKASNMP